MDFWVLEVMVKTFPLTISVAFCSMCTEECGATAAVAKRPDKANIPKSRALENSFTLAFTLTSKLHSFKEPPGTFA